MSSYSEYYRNASLYAASFDCTRIELQFLNLYGRVDNSTQGVAAGTAPQTPELARALESGSIEVFSGKDPVTGESVMAVTTPLKFNGSTVAFMRYVTATRQIDHQILLTILIISAIIAVQATARRKKPGDRTPVSTSTPAISESGLIRLRPINPLASPTIRTPP